MYPNLPATLYHSSRCTADTACEHCQGVTRHESWCITLNASVTYAYQVVLDAEKMTEGDRLILHALGVEWVDKISGHSDLRALP